jgi:hypothetical protein
MQVLDLVQFDPTLNCFVLKGNMKTYPPTWPDGTPKSTNNAFNWRTDTPSAAPKPKTPNARSQDLNSNGNINTYSKASSTRAPYGRTKTFENFATKI